MGAPQVIEIKCMMNKESKDLLDELHAIVSTYTNEELDSAIVRTGEMLRVSEGPLNMSTKNQKDMIDLVNTRLHDHLNSLLVEEKKRAEMDRSVQKATDPVVQKPIDDRNTIREAANLLASNESCRGYACGSYSCKACPLGSVQVMRRQAKIAKDMLRGLL